MKYILLSLGCILLVHANPLVLRKLDKCECSTLLKPECEGQTQCKWSGTACASKACEEFTTEDKCGKGCVWNGTKCISSQKACKDMPNEESCSNKAECGWKNNACINFTKCSDFTVSRPERCNVLVGLLGERCQPKRTTSRFEKHLQTATTSATTTQTQCENKLYVDCTRLTTQATCQGDASAKAKCQWKSDGKCYAFELKSCADASGFNSALCDPQFCKPAGTLCSNKACEDLTTQAACTTLPQPNKNFAILCQWTNNKCVTPNDTAFLTSATCNSATLGTYRWVASSATPATGTCTQCIAQILSIILIVMAFAIL